MNTIDEYGVVSQGLLCRHKRFHCIPCTIRWLNLKFEYCCNNNNHSIVVNECFRRIYQSLDDSGDWFVNEIKYNWFVNNDSILTVTTCRYVILMLLWRRFQYLYRDCLEWVKVVCTFPIFMSVLMLLGTRCLRRGACLRFRLQGRQVDIWTVTCWSYKDNKSW